ncbi:MAG: hypothetical protein CMJ21_01425 [Phycisphaerae bacterium]|nr:hypothetical protein [Phycisphaerae bacterium]
MTWQRIRQLTPPMRFGDEYAWLVLVSSIDVMLTGLILSIGGTEVNVIADRVIVWGGFRTAIIYKYALVVMAIVLCEEVGRMREASGRRLAHWLIGLGCLPVMAAYVQLAMHIW